MPCQKISPPISASGFEPPISMGTNPMPAALRPAIAGAGDYYLCDAGEMPAVAGNSVPATAAPLLKSALWMAPPALAAKPQLPPPPDTPLARLLYEVTTQLQDFQLTADLKLPMKGIGSGTVETFTRAVLKDQGALVELGIEFKPFAGPQALVPVLNQVPILGPFFVVRILKVEMDPNTRKLKARVKYLWFPVTKDVHEDYVKKAQLPPGLMRGPGFDLMKGLPTYSWQIFDLLLKILESRGAQVAKNVGVDQVKPILDRGEIHVEGDFSNQTVKLGGLQLQFAPLAPGEQHRLTISGPLTEPIVKVYGLKAAELQGSGGQLRLVNAGQRLEPLEFRIRIDPLGQKPTVYEVPSYQSNRVFIETPQTGSKDSFRLSLEEGVELKGMRFYIGTDGPHLEADRLAVKQLSFEGLGVQLRTTPGDQAVFENMQVQLVGGRPQFISQLNGKGSGDLRITHQGIELGFLKFQSLQGQGSLKILPETDGTSRVELTGILGAELPELRFLVKSEQLKAWTQTRVENATISGVGQLRIWPETQKAEVSGIAGKDPISIRGKGGMVTLHQDTSQVEAWGELKTQLGETLAKQVVTDFFIQPRDISFNVTKMALGRIVPQDGQPALEIIDADLGPIRIQGDAWGKIFARLPGGIYFPVVIPEEAKMLGADIEIGRLRDTPKADKSREISFQEIVLKGEESKATFSAKDRKRCGIDRQHIHAALGLFQFTPEDREIQIQKIDPHFHIYLKNPLLGGCLKVE